MFKIIPIATFQNIYDSSLMLRKSKFRNFDFNHDLK